MNHLTKEKLMEFASLQKIDRIGWFQGKPFTSYLQALRERPEYKLIKYRSSAAFEKAGAVPPEFKTVIVFVTDYFHDSNYSEGELKASNYSRYCWNTIWPKVGKVIDFIKACGHTAFQIDIPARGAACLAGLGAIGKNCNFYAEGLGSYVGIICIGTDWELDDKANSTEQRTMASCSNCNRCIKACPVNAISPEGYRINPLRCISFLNRHPEEPNKIFPEKQKQLDNWIAGCEICQDVCPVNKNIKHNTALVETASLKLYGMEIPNKSSVGKELVRQSVGKANSDYKHYLEMMIERSS